MGALLAVLLLGILGAKVPSDAKIAATIEQAIREQLHPASVQVVVQRKSPFSSTLDRVDVTISGVSTPGLSFFSAPAAPAAQTPGAAVPPRPAPRMIRIVDLHLLCRQVDAGTLPIAEMGWQLHEVRVPVGPAGQQRFTIAAAEQATGYFLLDEKGLTNFLRSRDLPLTDPTVTLTDAGCTLRGNIHLLVRVPVEISGHITARDQAKLHLTDPKLHLSVVPIPDAVAQRLLRNLNPLTDLNADLHLPAPLTITQVTHGAGAVRFATTLQFPPPEK
ncbi:MAG TPA: DUF2993 domain-containing protein [Armatimonadota bacterium]|jgi:hypothetical protein